jgi:hypothetical protein
MGKLLTVENGFDIGGDSCFQYVTADPTSSGVDLPESSLVMMNTGSDVGLYQKTGATSTDWKRLVFTADVGTDTYYSNSSTTAVDWDNGAFQRLTARSGTVTLSFSNAVSSKSYTLVIEASGGNITFVLPVGHYTASGASSVVVASGKLRVLTAHYINTSYFWELGSDLDAVAAGQTPIVWDEVHAHLSVDASNDLSKTSGSSDWVSGATSTASFSSGDCFVDTIVDETNKARMFGLGGASTGENYADIEFAVYMNSSAQISTYYAGSQQSSEGSYANGDVLRVAVESGSVVFRKNDTLLHTFSQSPSSFYPLYVDCSLNSPGGTLKDVTHT